ncbi:MAG: outer membrane beta-barrel protein [Bacteroidetes bacterium]|nr:outer membrane beta-barrel protein [Bacteroidota bacterium]
MKRIYIVLATLLAVTTTQAQLSINGGLALPTGSFGKGNYADETSGFAKAGAHFNISYTHYLNKHWGIGALAGYSAFGFKGAQSLSDGYKEDSGTDSTTLYRKGNNSTLTFLIGPYYKIQLCKNLSLDAHLLGGYTHTHLAGFQIFYEDYTDNSMTQREGSGGAFGWQAGLGIHYALTHKWSVQINGDYFSSKPNIPIQYDNFVVNSGRRLSSYNQTISGINATIGVSYALF